MEKEIITRQCQNLLCPAMEMAQMREGKAAKTRKLATFQALRLDAVNAEQAKNRQGKVTLHHFSSRGEGRFVSILGHSFTRDDRCNHPRTQCFRGTE